MEKTPHIHSIRLKNFTAFEDATFEFCEGVNVLVGENGTGKTHVLKALYAFHLEAESRGKPRADFSRVFHISSIHDLLRISPSNGQSEAGSVIIGISGHDLVLYMWTYDWTYGEFASPITLPRPTYIPAIDMLGHTRRFVATYDAYDIDFDYTHRDIVSLLLSPQKRILAPEAISLLELLHSKMGGEFVEEGERFFFKTTSGKIPAPLMAEGVRKLGMLAQLLKNGFLSPGSTLYWDEPETNMNPSLMDELAEILLALSRNGVQVFLATHNYVLLKELEVQAEAEDKLRYFALEKTENGVIAHSAERYQDIKPNLIEEQYLSLYDRSIKKRLRPKDKAQ